MASKEGRGKPGIEQPKEPSEEIVDWARKKFLTVQELNRAKKYFGKEAVCCNKGCPNCVRIVADCIQQVLNEKKGNK